VTETTERYEALALELATQPQRLAEVKARLSANRRATPLFDSEGFTRDFERLLETLQAS
jgi:predicted O-linked N-acetylglucosamine transferase (SPINDLY family)